MSDSVPKRMNTGLRAILLYVSIAALVVVIYLDTFGGLARMWSMSRYQYGYVVLPIAAYLLWRRRDQLASRPLTPAVLAFGVLLLLALAWVVARSTSVQVIEQLAVLAMIPAAALAIGGWSAFRAAAFPLLFVLAALPVGDGLVPQLMLITAGIAEALLNLFGIPVYRQGMIFVLPGGSFEVADICAGLMYLLSGTFVSILYAQLSYEKTWKRVAFVAIGALTVLFANALRAFITMAVASATNMRVLGGDDHIYFGHALFGATVLLLFWIGRRFRDPMPPTPLPAQSEVAGTSARSLLVGWLAAAALLAIGPLLEAQRRDVAAGPQRSVQLPGLAGCEGPDSWALDWQPEMPSPDVQTTGSYACGSDRVHLYIAAYRTQEQGRELVAEGNAIVPKRVLAQMERGISQFSTADGKVIRVSELRTGDPSGQLVVWYWYSVNGAPAYSSLEVKFREAIAAVTAQPVLSAVHVVLVELPATDAAMPNRARIQSVAQEAWAHYSRQEAWLGEE